MLGLTSPFEHGPTPRRTSREHLATWTRQHLPGRRLVVLSNREPYSHHTSALGTTWVRNAGGLTVALDAVMQAVRGVWVAHGSGDADRTVVDSGDRLGCPPDRPRYTLRRLWLTELECRRYYSGFANSALWPLCHVAYVRPRFRAADWRAYQRVNLRFAEAAIAEAGDGPALILIQDYHLALAARYIREKRPDLQTALFWHIPWPNPEIFRILPWRDEVLEGLLANDVVGFHIQRHARNFLDSVAETLEGRVDLERQAVDRAGRRTWVRPFAISVDAAQIESLANSRDCRKATATIRARLGLGDATVILGVDRFDYTKGIPERLRAFERLLESHPEWVGRLVFIQIGVPSRTELREYGAVLTRTRRIVERINQRFPREGGTTACLIEDNLDFRHLIPYYRLARVCAVTSLHDGMNLVAKEYVAACTDLEGGLVLSPFTGAVRELERAWVASPYDRDGLAAAFHDALTCPPAERRERMAALRETVSRHNVFDWTIELLNSVSTLGLRTVPAGTGDGGETVAPKPLAAAAGTGPA